MYQHLSHRDRIAIAALDDAGHSLSEIAAQLRVHRSTISRELKHNGDAAKYDPSVAHKLARGKAQPLQRARTSLES